MIKFVGLAHAKDFSKIWTHNGLSIALDDVHCQFAADFANIMLNSFIEQQKKAFEAAKKLQEEKKVITEG